MFEVSELLGQSNVIRGVNFGQRRRAVAPIMPWLVAAVIATAYLVLSVVALKNPLPDSWALHHWSRHLDRADLNDCHRIRGCGRRTHSLAVDHGAWRADDGTAAVNAASSTSNSLPGAPSLSDVATSS